MWEYKGGKGIWQQHVNTETGEKSLNEITPKIIKTYCKDHYFVLENPSSRTLVCKECGMMSNFIPGIHKLKDGTLSPA